MSAQLAGDESADPVTLGPYRLVHRIGEGGMGVVYLALDPAGRAVALKALRSCVAADPLARLRLSREVATLRRVRHPQVAEVLDADVDGERPYLVTRFVPGLPLDGHVGRFGPLAPQQVAHVGRVLAGALIAIHAAGIVHRDVKPANVVLLDGDPVLIDFGIAHLADDSRITMTGLVMGTPGYLSPEVVGGQELTPAGDWWGWGATLSFAATGRPPFGTGPVEIVLDRVRRGHADLAGVADPPRGALARALSLDPALRSDPAVLLAGLGGEPVTAPTTPVHVPPTKALSAAPTAPVRPAPATPAPARVTPVRLAPVRPAPVTAARVAGAAAAPWPVSPVRATPPRVLAPHPPAATYPPQGPYPSQWAYPARGTYPPPGVYPTPGSDPPVGPIGGRGGRVAMGLAGLIVALAAMAAVAPGGAVVVAAIGMVLARTVDRSVTGLLRRRVERGRRGSDVAVVALAAPGRAVMAGLTTVAALVLPVLVGASAAFLAGLATARNGAPAPGAGPALAVGMVAGLVTAWWGPGGASVRRGTRMTVRALTSSRVGSWGLLGVLALVVVAALMVAGRSGSTDWAPLHAVRAAESAAAEQLHQLVPAVLPAR